MLYSYKKLDETANHIQNLKKKLLYSKETDLDDTQKSLLRTKIELYEAKYKNMGHYLAHKLYKERKNPKDDKRSN